MPTRLYALALGLLVACYEPPAASCTISCTPESGCPGDLSCVENVCTAAGESCELPPLDWKQVTTGATFACGLTTEDKLYCWGNHRRGQLGVGDTAVVGETARPKKVNDKTWSTVSAGAEHACGLVDGIAYCWGYNADGQVRGEKGSGFTQPQTVIAQLGNEPPKFETISAGSRHTCAVGKGELWCWGNAAQVGVANVVATRIGTLGDWTQVSAGYDHTCALSAGSGVHCWGENGQGQVTSPPSVAFADPTPVSVAGLTVTNVVVGDQTSCAIAGAGELYCWGRNNHFQIDMTRVETGIPTRIGMESGWTDVAIGGDVVCGVRAGLVKCWGYDNGGALGSGVWFAEIAEPMTTPILGAEKVALSKRGYAGQIDDTPGYLRFACALGGTKIFCWGDNQLGQLAMGTTSMRRTPVLVEPPAGQWMALWAGNEHACAMTTASALYCWGADFDGQITAGIPRGVTQPCVKDQPCDFAKPTLAPAAIARVDDLVLGREYSCARDATTIRCWGRANLGASPTGGIAQPRAPMSSVWMKVWGGRYGTCGLTTQGAFACWGNVAGTGTGAPTTVTSQELVNIGDVTIGENNMCAHRTSDSARVCWGQNTEGMVGNGTNVGQATPQALDGGMIADIAMGSRHACAATIGGNVLCWGNNQFAQAGGPDGNSIFTPSPVTGPAGNITGCTRVATGDRHSCAICEGAVHCWGEDDNGALGRLDTNNTSSRVALPITLEGERFVEVVARNYGTCAMTVDGKVYCWGTGQYGGNGDGGQSLNLPREIVSR